MYVQEPNEVLKPFLGILNLSAWLWNACVCFMVSMIYGFFCVL